MERKCLVSGDVKGRIVGRPFEVLTPPAGKTETAGWRGCFAPGVSTKAGEAMREGGRLVDHFSDPDQRLGEIVV